MTTLVDHTSHVLPRESQKDSVLDERCRGWTISYARDSDESKRSINDISVHYLVDVASLRSRVRPGRK